MSLNKQRAEWADKALNTFRLTQALDISTPRHAGWPLPGNEAVQDLINSAMHWCDQNGVDFTEALQIARTHFNEEKRRNV